MKTLFNIKGTGICAFCQHWYDPVNSAIEPDGRMAGAGYWLYDKKARRLCSKKGIEMWAWCRCREYRCKI